MVKIHVGDRVVFNSEKIETFKNETSGKSKELQDYQKIVLGGIEQIGIVKELGEPLTTVSYSDGWDVPIPTKYLILA